MKKVLIIPPQQKPIPAVKGGAVENLITNILNQNEINKKVALFVISKYDKEAKKISYENAKIFYLKNYTFDSLVVGIKNFFRKISFNKLTKIFCKKTANTYHSWTIFGYQCLRIAKRVKPDIIVSESYDQFNRLWPLVKKFKNTTFYYHLHYVREEKLDLRQLFPNTIAISSFVLNHWVKDKTIPGRNIVVLNGIDIKPFSDKINEEKKSGLKKSLSISKDDFVVLFTGRLRPHKGLLELLRAFSSLEVDNFKLLILGDFLSETDRNDRMMELEFEKECMLLIDSDQRILRLGRIDYENIPLYYQISDIQCIPSIWEEGAGLVAVEGMASGLPLIITKSGGMPEYTGNDCAIILERNNSLVENIAKSINDLYKNVGLRQKMSANGRERAKLFTKKKFYQDYISALLD